MTRTIIYVRISDDPTGQAAGTKRQEAECRLLADSLGWDVVDVLRDNDVSAAGTKRRKGYEQLLLDLAAGRAEAVLAWHPDRLYRKLADLERFIDVVNAHHIQVRTVRAGEIELATPTGRAMARTAAVWAGHEVEHGIERMRSAKTEAAQQGRYRGGPRNFGYLKDGVTILETEAHELREAARRVLAGEKVSPIVKEWNARGVGTLPPLAHRNWTVTSLRGLLTRPRNAALIVVDGQEYRAQWPPILSEAEHRGLVALFADPTRHSGGPRGDHTWLLSGTALCGRCDDGTPVKLGHHGTYRCRDHNHLQRKAAPVDQFVLDVLLGVDDMPGILTRPGVRLRLHDVPEEDLAAMEGEATAIRAAQDGLRHALGRREIDLAGYRIAMQQMDADLAKVEARLAESSQRSPLSGIADAPDVRAAFLAAPVSRQRAVIDALCVVTLLPAALGRQPDGSYFDENSITIVPK